MTTITPSPGHDVPAAPARRRKAFTLVEVLIGAALSGFVLVGVLATFLFLGRSGANIQNYNDMESQARRALEQFAQDTRQASSITWNSANSVTMMVDSVAVTYTYASGRFVRISGGAVRILLTGITTFAFKAYTITGAEIPGIGTTTTLASAGQTTKQLQISLSAQRRSQTVTTATNNVLSARFILRNKRVTA